MNILDDFFVKGIGKVNDPDAFQFLLPIIDKLNFQSDGLSEYCLIAKETEELVDALEDTGDYLFNKYLNLVFQKNDLVYTSIWKGADRDAQVWHNDYDEGADLAFLCYFDNMTEETGGGLSFRDGQNNIVVDTLYPNKFDVVLFNQQERWHHKVTPLNQIPCERLVMNFGYNTNR